MKGLVSVIFPFSKKQNCNQKSVKSLQIDEVVTKQQNKSKAFKFVSYGWV